MYLVDILLILGNSNLLSYVNLGALIGGCALYVRFSWTIYEHIAYHFGKLWEFNVISFHNIGVLHLW